MFQLRVYHRGASHPSLGTVVASATEVMQVVQELLAEHPGCSAVEVWFGGARLFTAAGGEPQEPLAEDAAEA